MNGRTLVTPRSPAGLRESAIAWVVFAGASVVAGIAFATLNPSVDACLVAAIALVLAAPIAVRLATRTFDIFDPIVISTLAFVAMYVLRPAALVADHGQKFFKGYEITGEIRGSLVTALLAVCAYQIGYCVPAARHVVRRMRAAEGRWALDLTVPYGIALILLAFALFALFLMQAGGLGLVVELAKGRSGAEDAYFRSSTAYLYSAPQLIWPASLLLVAAGIASKRKPIIGLAVVAMIPALLFAGGRGSRITLLPLLLAPFIYWYLSKNKRPRALVILVVGYLVFTVGIAFFRDTRTQGEDIDRIAVLQESILNPGSQLDQLVNKGTDNDMFESLAAERKVVPSLLKPDPADFAIRTLAKPVPSIIWRGKPTDPEEHLNDVLFPNEQSRASTSTGIVGSMFLAGWYPGVIVGMALFGLLFRIPWEYYRRFPHTSSAQLLLVSTAMFIPILLRGAFNDTVARALFNIVPLLIAIKLCRVPAEERR